MAILSSSIRSLASSRAPFQPTLLAVALSLAGGSVGSAWAQQAPAAPTPAPASASASASAAADTASASASTDVGTASSGTDRPHKHKLDVVVVTGNPLSQKELAAPVQVLSGDALTLKRGASLGETLDGLAGVGSTYFGPNSNRPTMRGLDGDRVRMLSNSGASVDASSLSFDHALPVDPLVLTRVEVLRGAAALQYGGNAIGGVVNAIDNRIPRLAQPGLNGAAELRLGGASKERGGAVVLDGGTTGFAWHVDAADRRADDQRVPRFESEDGSSTHVRNSDSHGRSGAVGGSLLFSQGYAGVSVEDYHNEYGVTVEPDVRIEMQRQRLATAGEWRDPLPGLARVTWQFASSRYKHQEVEGSGEVGTVFSSDGKDGRIEATHSALQGAWGSMQGVLGWQWELSDFSALGEEALVPGTKTRNNALFLIEQFRSGPWSLQAGARAERVNIGSEGGGDEDRFGDPMTRRFSPKSFSLSGAYELGNGFSLSSNLSSSQRAPTFYELFANGVHVASGAYEVGDINLGLERAKAVDLGLHWKQGDAKWSVQVYQTRFSNYIALDASGRSIEEVGEDGGIESVPEYLYRGVRARMHGVELEGKQPLSRLAGWDLTLGTTIDLVRGTNRDTNEPLPRLAPVRGSVSIQAERGPWLVQAELRGAMRQDKVPALDTPTAGYGILRLNIARHFDIGNLDAMWYLKLDNLANKLAYNASSVQTIRELTPLPGRSLFAGLQVKF
jgi:iron complex outermembrane receptor protein